MTQSLNEAQMQAGSFSSATAITTSDSATNSYDAIYVGGAGNVAVILAGDTAAVTFTAPPVGTTLRLKTSKVMATNTTATLLIGLRV
jgi:hypothetical protein